MKDFEITITELKEEFSIKVNEFLNEELFSSIKQNSPFKAHLHRVRINVFRNRVLFLFKKIKKYLKEDMEVLDIGSSIGHLGAFIKMNENINFKYHCLDIDEDCIRIIPKFLDFLNLDVESVVLGTMEKMPYKDNSFDMVWLFEWFGKGFNSENLDPYDLFNNVIRILKPNGILMCNICHGCPQWHRPIVDGEFDKWLEEKFEILYSERAKECGIYGLILRVK